MKAIVHDRYGPPEVLSLREVERPVPGKNEVLVCVRATTVNRTDSATVEGIPLMARMVTGLFRPKWPIPGSEFAGEVEALGEGVTEYRPGDRVFGFRDLGAGAHAEVLAIPQDHLRPIPGTLSFEVAAAGTEGVHYAKNFINKVPLKSGDAVLVNGATGAIGSALVQLLKVHGAKITAVCGADHFDLVRSLGAEELVDYSREDFTQLSTRFEYVFDAVGKSSFFKCRRLLRPGGIYISSDLGFLAQNLFLPLLTGLLRPLLGGRRTRFPLPVDIPESLDLVRSLREKGDFTTIIDRTYPLEDTPEAYRYVAQGRKIGNVVITGS